MGKRSKDAGGRATIEFVGGPWDGDIRHVPISPIFEIVKYLEVPLVSYGDFDKPTEVGAVIGIYRLVRVPYCEESVYRWEGERWESL
jgi:hypothetical protein